MCSPPPPSEGEGKPANFIKGFLFLGGGERRGIAVRPKCRAGFGKVSSRSFDPGLGLSGREQPAAASLCSCCHTWPRVRCWVGNGRFMPGIAGLAIWGTWP